MDACIDGRLVIVEHAHLHMTMASSVMSYTPPPQRMNGAP